MNKQKNHFYIPCNQADEFRFSVVDVYLNCFISLENTCLQSFHCIHSVCWLFHLWNVSSFKLNRTELSRAPFCTKSAYVRAQPVYTIFSISNESKCISTQIAFICTFVSQLLINRIEMPTCNNIQLDSLDSKPTSDK